MEHAGANVKNNKPGKKVTKFQQVKQLLKYGITAQLSSELVKASLIMQVKSKVSTPPEVRNANPKKTTKQLGIE